MNARQMPDEILSAFARLLTQLSAACRRGDEITLAELREAWASLEREYGRSVAPLEVYAYERPDTPQLPDDCMDEHSSPADQEPLAHGTDPRRGSDGRWISKGI